MLVRSDEGGKADDEGQELRSERLSQMVVGIVFLMLGINLAGTAALLPW
jgi:hypothetical protein